MSDPAPLVTDEVMSAAESATSRGLRSKDMEFRYFCGICWSKIKEAADGAR